MKQCFCTVDQLFLKPEGTFVAHKVLVIGTAKSGGSSSRQPAIPPSVVTPVEIVAGAVHVGAVVALARQTSLLDLLLDVDIAGSPWWRGAGRLEVMAQECVACQCRVGRGRRRRRWVKGRRWFAMTYVWRQETWWGRRRNVLGFSVQLIVRA